MLVAVYSFLIVLALVNIWQILIKQGKYKTLPLLFFYIYSIIAIALRLICLVWMFGRGVFENVLDDIYVGAKLCVGFVQAWIIFEIALRVRNLVSETNATAHQEGASTKF